MEVDGPDGRPTVAIACPFESDSLRGNTVSAHRIARLLSELGQNVRLLYRDEKPDWDGVDALLALHAFRTASLIEGFHRSRPDKPIVVFLTGSDVHHDLHRLDRRDTVLRSMEMAERIALSQEGSLAEVPDGFHSRVRVVYKSISYALPPRLVPASKDPFRVLLTSHLRPAKNPSLAIEAVRLLPAESRIRFDHFGHEEHPDLGQAARAFTETDERYTWHGGVDPAVALQALAGAHLSINTSDVEGGANALCETFALGVPCLATDIPPNLGMVGPDYPGIFPAGEAKPLATMMGRAETDPSFYQELEAATARRAGVFTVERERDAWLALWIELGLAATKKG
ncbi:MAG: glycosyltransferase family 4 protein [Verrucomicrobiota bacterium]